MKLLLIEDEQDLRDSIEEYLESEGFMIEIAATYFEAEEKICSYDYDCLIVDIGLPDGNGLNIIRELKKGNSEAGVIIVSAKNSLDDRLEGLDIGADDYLIKPFHLSELNARIKSIIRRRSFKGANLFSFNEIKIDYDKRQVWINDLDLTLTRKEYDLLLYFITNKGKVLDKESIAEHLWGDNMSIVADSFDFIYTHIKNLRKKMLELECTDYIQTVYGIGYKFDEK